eukprot:gnl/TRDRNA2_/TRDRNA2_123354_c0_seq1.p3 gnl/TRDRNA2_/TRDRNA2_123354_c0~~gnl/TRDRNA2_/TRDRNA2_123354_c0_seq1.p3  ORF type:complete len:103 (-),score=8.75 gnl/TRDRNA2_/TRDRNA2_123354_c0_seq1:55-363(-)
MEHAMEKNVMTVVMDPATATLALAAAAAIYTVGRIAQRVGAIRNAESRMMRPTEKNSQHASHGARTRWRVRTKCASSRVVRAVIHVAHVSTCGEAPPSSGLA